MPILSSLLGYVFGGAALFLLVVAGVQSYRLSLAQTDLAQEQTLNVRLTDNNLILVGNETRLKNSITEQNEKVEALRVEGETRSKAAMEELARVRNTLVARNNVLVAQLAVRRPPPGIDVCVAALDEARNPNL